MSDCADDSDEKIEAVVALGRTKIERALRNSTLRPIVFEEEIDGHKKTYGMCHWCESTITPGHLFCNKDPQDTGMCCSESWEHDHKRRRDTGV